MSGSDTIVTFPEGPLSDESFRMPRLPRSWRYVQNCVCLREGYSYSSQAMAYVFSTAEDGMERFLFIALATASSTSIRFMSSVRSFESDTELYIIALAARTCSTVISPESSSSAMLAARSSSSIAILASPNSADSSAIITSGSSEYVPGYSASCAREDTISKSSWAE